MLTALFFFFSTYMHALFMNSEFFGQTIMVCSVLQNKRVLGILLGILKNVTGYSGVLEILNQYNIFKSRVESE